MAVADRSTPATSTRSRRPCEVLWEQGKEARTERLTPRRSRRPSRCCGLTTLLSRNVSAGRMSSKRPLSVVVPSRTSGLYAERVMATFEVSSTRSADLGGKQRSRDIVSRAGATLSQPEPSAPIIGNTSAHGTSGSAPLPAVSASTNLMGKPLLTADDVAGLLRVPPVPGLLTRPTWRAAIDPHRRALRPIPCRGDRAVDPESGGLRSATARPASGRRARGTREETER